MFPAPEAALQTIVRWFHVMAGIVWLGHLFFLSLVNVPFQAGISDDLKRQINPALLGRVLFFFRHAAAWTWFFGLVLFAHMYGHGRLLLDADGRISDRGAWMLLGSILGTVMVGVVWGVIWPRQRRLLAALTGGPPARPNDAAQAALAGSVNGMLAGPMLWGMIGASHAHLWPFTWATLIVAVVLSVGLFHGLTARARKLRVD